jgi:predicted AAA+ superfamily ATPase
VKARRIKPFIDRNKASKLGRIMVFTGARQTGKTTFAKNQFPDYSFISVEDPVTRKEYTKLSAAQWKLLYPRAILDEVQKQPTLIESIKSVYDQWDEPRYVLSGSSQLLLMEKVKESLAGRCIISEIYPLTLPELSTKSWDDEIKDSLFQQLLMCPTDEMVFLPSFLLDKRMPEKQQAWVHYLKFGGYPALTDASMNDEDRYLWLSSYVRTYLERDIRDLASFRDLEPFIKLQQALAINTGTLVNASSLGTQIGMTAKSVLRFIQYLELSYQTIRLPSWERNLTKRLVKASKTHYLDNGVLQAVLKKRGGITGFEFESLVIAELFKQAKTIQSQASFYHLRTFDGKEVDLLIELPEGYFAFEIKMTDRVSKTDARHLKDLEEILDKPLLKAFILSADSSTTYFDEKVVAISAPMFLG